VACQADLWGSRVSAGARPPGLIPCPRRFIRNPLITMSFECTRSLGLAAFQRRTVPLAEAGHGFVRAEQVAHQVAIRRCAYGLMSRGNIRAEALRAPISGPAPARPLERLVSTADRLMARPHGRGLGPRRGLALGDALPFGKGVQCRWISLDSVPPCPNPPPFLVILGGDMTSHPLPPCASAHPNA
jgi:hypothetical protein